MARMGTQKVKTGCTTCKIRKVKCDEDFPNCKRCVSTGRKCDGYVSPPIGTYAWSQLLLPPVRPPLAQAMSKTEQRVMSFFRELVAPVLAGPLNGVNGYFWTNIVTQVSHQEVAAKHAVLAISSFYKTFCEDPKGLSDKNQMDPYAIWHYNEAVKHLQTNKDHGTIVFVCILFVCIEFLRGDCESAVKHCRHGINMLNQIHTKSVFMRDYLSPAFSRLSIFPYFFGVNPSTFPCLEGPVMAVKAPFQNITDAHSMLSPLLVRTLRFVRSADAYRLGVVSIHKPDGVTMQERQAIESALDSWSASFYLCKSRTMSDLRDDNIMQLVEIQWLICKIWMATCWELEEMVYDEHMDKFRSIVDLATEAVTMADSSANGHNRGKFTFEMGFGPLLAFVVIKCRRLDLRVAAMRLIKRLSLPRENSWDRADILSIGRRTIEIEHDLELDIEQHEVIDNGTLPPEEKRIKDSVMKFESDAQSTGYGDNKRRRKIHFLVKNPDGEDIVIRDEWLPPGRIRI